MPEIFTRGPLTFLRREGAVMLKKVLGKFYSLNFLLDKSLKRRDYVEDLDIDGRVTVNRISWI
jgi:hypothetical protein